jgi:hypothetical protein
VSNTQRIAIATVRFVPRKDLRRKSSSEGTRRARKRRKNFSRQILRKGPTVVESVRKCTRFSPLECTGEISTCEVAKSRNHLDPPSRDTWRDLGISLTRKVYRSEDCRENSRIARSRAIIDRWIEIDHESSILSHRKIGDRELDERRRALQNPIREISTSQIAKSREDCEPFISKDKWQQIQVPSSRKDHSRPFDRTRGGDRGNR